MIILKPQSGTSLPCVIKEAIKICKVLDKAKMHPAIDVEFNDIRFGVNEKCTVDGILNNVFYKIKCKYEKEGGTNNHLTHSGNYWIEELLDKKSE